MFGEKKGGYSYAEKVSVLKKRGVFRVQKVSVFIIKGGILHPKVGGKGTYFKPHNTDGVV